MLYIELWSLRHCVWSRPRPSEVHRLRRYCVSLCLEFRLLSSGILQQLPYLLQVLLNRALLGP